MAKNISDLTLQFHNAQTNHHLFNNAFQVLNEAISEVDYMHSIFASKEEIEVLRKASEILYNASVANTKIAKEIAVKLIAQGKIH